MGTFAKSSEQSKASCIEQKFSLEVSVRLLVTYSQYFCPVSLTFTKGEIIHGYPACGKTHVAMYIELYAISQGLNVLMAVLMGQTIVVF